MDRDRKRYFQHEGTVQTGRHHAVGSVLHAFGRNCRESDADEASGRTVHGDAVLWRATDDGLASQGRLRRQPEARSTLDETNGIGSNLPEAKIVAAVQGTSNLSLSTPRIDGIPSESSLEHGHNVHSAPSGFYLSGRDYGLVQSLCSGMGSIGYAGIELLPRGVGLGSATGAAGHFQYGPGESIHQLRFYGSVVGPRHPRQYGWPRTRTGQHLRRTTLAHGQIRRGLPERLPECARGNRLPDFLFSFLQSKTNSSGSRLQNPGSRLSGGAMTRLAERSGRMADPGAKNILVCVQKRGKARKSSSGRNLEKPPAFPDFYRKTHSLMVKGIHLIEK
jgi:hypothetical protein